MSAEERRINIDARQVMGPVSRFLTGACIEDVNHEIYGGVYSQMLFGESFQEPPVSVPPRGFRAFGGEWKISDGELHGSAGDGPKLASELPPFTDGEASIEMFFADRKPGNAGLLLRLGRPGMGADTFDAYEVSLDAAAQVVRLGRHRHDWQLIQDTPAEIPVGAWIRLAVTMNGPSLEIFLNGRSIFQYADRRSPLLAGTVGLRQWQREARYRNLRVKSAGKEQFVKFEPEVSEAVAAAEVSGMWRAFQTGHAKGAWAIEKQEPFAGLQSQRLALLEGAGEVGIENEGLNHWGLHLIGGRKYEGLIWARAGQEGELWVALESEDGRALLAEERIKVKSGDWQRLQFALTPKRTAGKGRFAVRLKRPGSVTLGYAFLQPGSWGRFKGLPVRRDVAEALVAQGITVLRYGGSMVNDPHYRWKNMIGARDRRPPYRGTWYPHSSNGWGILDFMEFCETAGFEYVPAFNMGESPQDMADFLEYAKGSTRTQWGQRRASDGHPKPYRLKYLQLGNEERVDEKYAAAFERLAEAIWDKDPGIILVVGDFAYSQPIQDPFNVRGAASGITNLAGQQRILKFAAERGKEVWFDVHVGTDGPQPDSSFDGMFSFRDALGKLAQGARHKVVVFEFNAGNHSMRRALANAQAIQAVERDGRIPIATSANCLQPDGQNDNGWDQGLLFLNPSQVWLQPPGYVTQMFSRNYLPQLVRCHVSGGAGSALDANAKCDAKGRRLVVTVVNRADTPSETVLNLSGFIPRRSVAEVLTLSGDLNLRNTSANPTACMPNHNSWLHGMTGGVARRTFPPHSFTVLVFE